MIFVYGSRLYGKIEEAAGTFIATRFAHVWFLPLFPLGSHLVLSQGVNGRFTGIPLKLDPRSVFSGYLRVWGPIGALLFGINALESVASANARSLGWMGGVVGYGLCALAAAAAAAFAWAGIGKLSREEREQRAVVALYAGYPIDPVHLGEGRRGLRDKLLAFLAQRVQGAVSTGYRAQPDPMTQWPQIALDPQVWDDQLLTAAFTLTRVEASFAMGQQKASWDDLGARLWARIQQMRLPYVQTAAAR